MDAISYLRKEHSKFRRTLTAISKIKNEKVKKRKFDSFCKDLTKHEKMEEKAWYPALKKKKELAEIIKHLVAEEKSAAQAIKKFKKVHFEFMWNLRFRKFKHDVDHHAKEEEQELFPKVRKYFNKAHLNQLGIKMRKTKAALK